MLALLGQVCAFDLTSELETGPRLWSWSWVFQGEEGRADSDDLVHLQKSQSQSQDRELWCAAPRALSARFRAESRMLRTKKLHHCRASHAAGPSVKTKVFIGRAGAMCVALRQRCATLEAQ